MRDRFFSIVSISLLLSGCMVGPDFHTPNPPATLSFVAAKPPSKKLVALNRDIPAEWWQVYHSEKLNYLIEKGLKNSADLVAAEAALKQAQENLAVQVGSALFPQVDAQLAGQRQRVQTVASATQTRPTIFNVFNASVDVSYSLDLFGGARREAEALRAQIDYQRFQLLAAHLTLTSNIVTTTMTIALAREQIKATEQLIRTQENELNLVEKQFRLGATSQADVLSQRTQLAQTRATLPAYQLKFSQNRHALAVLIGELPSESQLPSFQFRDFHLPTPVPVTVPSALVRQRPDILASEALLHAASAEIGVAAAQMYPQFNLTGRYGWESNVFSKLILPEHVVWNIGSNIAAPIFHGGALLAKKRAAVAAYQQSFAQYRQTVLQAFKNVADSLRALEYDDATYKAQYQSQLAASRALALIRQQYRLGGASYLDVITAERNYQQAYLARIQAQAARYIDTAALFQASGGGWWNRRING